MRAAGSTTQERRRLFDQGPVGDATRSAGAAGEFRLPSSAVPQRFFVPGARGFEAMQALRTAAPEAMGQVRDYALATLRRDAMRMDGTLDPAKVQTWRRKYGDALRAIPEVDRMLADPVQASEAFAQVAAQRKAQMDAFQEGAVSRLLGLDDPADVTKTIGGIFSRQDQVKQMARLVRETAGNEEARQGLRKAVADYVNTRFISNTEAGTSGVDQIRSDQFQQFLKQSAPALRTLFSGDEMKTLYAIAADLKRSNRSVSAVKLPGASNTAQDTAALAKADQQPSVLSRALTAGGAALAGTAAGGPWGAIAAAMGTEAVQTLRNAGLRNVDDLVRDAMLNPALARVLLAKAPAAGGSQMNRALLQRMLAAALTRPAIGAGVQGGAAGER